MSLADIKVRNRLLIGFSSTLLLLLAIAALSWYSMSRTESDTDELLGRRLHNERLIYEWQAIIDINIQRSLAAGKTTDPAVQKFFEAGIAATSARASAIQEELAHSLQDPAAKAIFADIAVLRAQYRRAREAAFAAKASGDIDKARQYFDHEFTTSSSAYAATLKKLSKKQEDGIDETGAAIHARNDQAIAATAALTLASVLIALAGNTLITRSLLRQLGGEPAYAAHITDRIAAGDLTVPVALRDGDTSSLLYSIRLMRDRLAAIVGDVRSGTAAVAGASEEIANGNLDLSNRTEQQAGSLEETASSMEELTATVRKNNDYARQANQLAASASAVAQRGGALVSQVVATMEAIDVSSKKIADINSVIDGIAFQTNILALNAAVEAARAGEQGRGFAVVASEVRNLAQRAAGAAKDIKTLIDDSVHQVGDGSALVHQAGATMEEIVDSVRQVTDIMEKISAAGAEQVTGIEQINRAIGEMDGVTQQNAALVEQAAAAAGALREQAAHLAGLVSVFSVGGVGGGAPRPRLSLSSPRSA